MPDFFVEPTSADRVRREAAQPLVDAHGPLEAVLAKPRVPAAR